MQKIEELLHASIVQKVCKELENHIGINDETLAEFIINLKKQSSNLKQFEQNLSKNSADFDITLVQSLWRMIEAMAPRQSKSTSNTSANPTPSDSDRSLKQEAIWKSYAHFILYVINPCTIPIAFTTHSVIQSPNHSTNGSLGTEENKKKFPGLCIPNTAPQFQEESIDKQAIKQEPNDDAPSPRSSRSSRHSPRSKKRKFSSRSRSRSPHHDRKRSRHDRDDRYDRDHKYNHDRDRYDDRHDRHRRDDRDYRNYRDRDNRGRYNNERNRDRYHDHHDQNHRELINHRGRGRGSGRVSGRGRGGGYDHQTGHGMDDKPIKYKIYNGVIESVRDFGCFIKLQGIAGAPTGLCYRNFITRDTPVPIVNNYVKRGQEVKVKVISLIETKIGLSIRSVDQKTGEDLAPRTEQETGTHDDIRENPSGINTLNGRGGGDGGGRGPRNKEQQRRRMSSPERWEKTQLKNAGVYDFGPDAEEDLAAEAEAEKELDIELNENEPAFLRGQIGRPDDNGTGGMVGGFMDDAAIRVCKQPDGSLHRAAILSSAKSKERREIREQKLKQETEAVPLDLSKNWSDPSAPLHDLVFAQQLRNMGQPNAAATQSAWKRSQQRHINASLGMSRAIPLSEQRKNLPIYALRSSLLEAVAAHDLLVVIGETGSGKTTQMTQYLCEAGYASLGVIGCTQPRRVAAMSVAQRVAEEYGCRVGTAVGYCIRFEDCTSAETIIRYMTDGMLLRECLTDPDLKRYSVIMLDEAHERGIHTDVLFALLKQCVARRNSDPNGKKLKLIITSATLDAEKFSSYFNSCAIFTIPGRLHPVEIMFSLKPESDYLDASLLTVLNIHLNEPAGDILVFLTGKEEIDTACQILYERCMSLKGAPPLIILPVYSALPSEQQTRIFEPAPKGCRKCVIATNIAEASLTIDGIYYVIDPGFVKQQVYNSKLRMDSLVITPISQQSATQRAGRAGRTGPGKCYRLYTQSAYKNEMLASTVPEIQRTNLGSTVLTLKAMGIHDLLSFDFMDSPGPATLIAAMLNLYNLGALDDEGLLTRLGRRMADFPLAPQMSKMLISAVDLNCTHSILTVVAMLQSDQIWYRPREKQAVADQRRAHFFEANGDHITLLSVYNKWKEMKYSNPWCVHNFIQSRSLKHAMDVRKQLVAICDRFGLTHDNETINIVNISKAITSGYFMHAAKKDPQEGYKTLVEGQPAYIHPSSALFNHQPDWLIFHHLVLTSKEYMRENLVIQPQWLCELAPRFYKKADPIRLSKRKRREKIEPLYDRYAEPNSWRLSRRRY